MLKRSGGHWARSRDVTGRREGETAGRAGGRDKIRGNLAVMLSRALALSRAVRGVSDKFWVGLAKEGRVGNRQRTVF